MQNLLLYSRLYCLTKVLKPVLSQYSRLLFEFCRNNKKKEALNLFLENIKDGRKVFYHMAERNVVSWTSLLGGYAQNGMNEEVLELFFTMQMKGIKPNAFTFAAVLGALVYEGMVDKDKDASAVLDGMETKNAVKRNCMIAGYVTNGLDLSAFEAFCNMRLADAYVKLGNIKEAANVFEQIDERDVVAWSAMLADYAQIGDSEGASKIFIRLVKEGIKPNQFTFSSVINACAAPIAPLEQGKQFHARSIKCKLSDALCCPSACSHPGLVGEGEKYFNMMPQDSAAYVLLSNIYAAAANWHETRNVRKLMEKRKVKKEAGYSWIEVKNKTHSFLAADPSHPCQIIYIQDLMS
ncbi:hypothetical protein CRYUN_Cryun25bG0083300 [Craigia yunnanensis]